MQQIKDKNNVKLVTEFHRLARLTTVFSHKKEALSEIDKLRALSAEFELKIIETEMRYRDIPIVNLGYSL